MKRMTLIIGMCLVSVVAFSAISAASAFAEEPMPYLFKFSKGEANEGGTFTSKGGHAELRTEATKVECESTKNNGTFSKTVGAHLGTVTVEFEKCTSDGFKCENEKGDIVLNGWEYHLGAGFDPELNRWIPAILILIKEKEFTFVCAGIITVHVKGTGVVGALYKHGTTEPLGLKEAVSEADLVFQSEKSSKPPKLLFSHFYFPLTKEEVGELPFEAESSLTKKFEAAEQKSTDTLEKFENSKKEPVTVELVE
jgi:hypothetical protein